MWIVDPDRGNRAAFSRHMTAQGFGLREERLHRAASAATVAYKGRLLICQRDATARSGSA